MKLSTIQTIQTVSGWAFFFSLVLIWLAFLLEVLFEKDRLAREDIEKGDRVLAYKDYEKEDTREHLIYPPKYESEPQVIIEVKQEMVPLYVKIIGIVMLIISGVGNLFSIMANWQVIKKTRRELKQKSNDKSISNEKKRKDDT